MPGLLRIAICLMVAGSLPADRTEWCNDQPYWSEHSPEVIDEVTLEFTGVTNQCFGEDEFSNSFYVGRLVFDPETDTPRDADDPEGWHHDRDSSVEPGDLFPTDGA